MTDQHRRRLRNAVPAAFEVLALIMRAETAAAAERRRAARSIVDRGGPTQRDLVDEARRVLDDLDQEGSK